MAPAAHGTHASRPPAARDGTSPRTRTTGIPVVGEAPWGTHFCQFYATKEDLVEILVPYFKAGLEANEHCMWVTSPPLGVDDAWAALARAVPDLDAYRRRGRIEIIPHTEWYLQGGRFDQERVLSGWVRRLEDALRRGCAGLRLSGNTFWLEKSDWRSFAEYEAAIDAVLGQYRMLALCTYSVDRCGASEVADVVRNHEFALIKRDGRWEVFESFDRRRMQDALAVERERLAVTLHSIGDAVIATDTEGRVTTLNRAAEALTGWTQAEAFGRPAAEVFRVVDERTGAPAEDPIRAVLASGAVVGLASDVALVARDGRRISIADSAAPIRGPADTTLGVVLVFRDVTAERRAAAALRESEQRVRLKLESILSPEGDIGGLDLGDIVDAAALQRLMDSFYELARIPMAVIDLEGEVLVGVGWQDVCTRFHRVHPETRRHCIESDTQLTAEVPPGEFKLYRCRNNMWDVATPLIVGGHHLGNVFMGQFFCWANVTLARSIAEREALMSSLRASKESLEAADRRKNEFLAMLSHELRNPLAPIANSIYILRRCDPGSEQARRARDVVERQTEHLTRLVDDLLDVTRIARGKVELRRERVDLGELVRRTAEDHRSTFERRGVALELASEAGLWADADPTRLSQVVGNLLQNAAKFTRRGDAVTLSLRGASGAAEIAVRDTGAGIDPALLAGIFEPFVQADRTLARAEGGLGLGLALVKGMTELHGGTVRAESAGKGTGATFVVHLPLSGPGPAVRPPAPGVPRRGPVRRVLVVDDDRDSARSLAEVVELLGHAADVACDGPSAIEKIRASAPDVVLCDLGLPGTSGHEIAKALRAIGGSAIRLVAVSGYAQPEDLEAAIDAGFDRHIAKPASASDIERLLA